MQWRRLKIRSLALAIVFAAFGTMLVPTADTANAPPPREVDVQRAAAAGLRELTGRHVRIFTDLPSSPAVDELPAAFDAAIPLWAEYFDLDEHAIDGKFLGFLVSDREKF